MISSTIVLCLISFVCGAASMALLSIWIDRVETELEEQDDNSSRLAD